MYEVELKFRLADVAAVERRLRELGAIAEPLESQSDCYLRHPCRDFAVTNEAFRVRMIGERSYVTYKGPVLDRSTKTRREIEVPLGGEPERRQWLELWYALGFVPVATVLKQRRPFRLEWNSRRLQLAIDEVPGVGTFLEIETLADGGDLTTAQTAVRQLAEAFGLGQAEEKSYLELVLETQPDSHPESC